MTYEAKTTNPCSAFPGEGSSVLSKRETPRRRRTIKDAEAALGRELNLSPMEKRQAMLRVRRARQPKREARRIIDHYQSRVVGDVCRRDGDVDQSDLEEIVAALLRRDGVICPPQSTMLNSLGRRIAEGSLTPAQFRVNAAALLAMVPALPKKFRVAESSYLQE